MTGLCGINNGWKRDPGSISGILIFSQTKKPTPHLQGERREDT